MASASRTWRTFGIAAASCGLVFWWFADWWAYIGPIPKFIMPWWWQVIVSGVVGAAAGGVLVGMLRLTCWAGSRRRPG